MAKKLVVAPTKVLLGRFREEEEVSSSGLRCCRTSSLAKGLSMTSFIEFNVALRGKRPWRFMVENESLWRKGALAVPFHLCHSTA